MINRPETKAIYAGTFDPPTNGHLWIIKEGARLYDQLIIAVGVNPDKNNLAFSVEDRVKMLHECTKDLKNVSVDSYENQYLVKYAEKIKVDYIIRGLRSSKDFDSEKSMLQFNRDINSNIETVFFMPPSNLSEISSSAVKALIGPEGWETLVAKYVPEPVLTELQNKYGRQVVK